MIQRNSAKLVVALFLVPSLVILGFQQWKSQQRTTAQTSETSSQAVSHRSLADQKIQITQNKLKVLPAHADLYAELATAYMLKARETGDGSHYGRAEAACKKALELDPKNYATLRLISWVYGGQHRFQEAVKAARRALEKDSKDPLNYGTLGDALVELGEYREAADAIQKMVDLRPEVNAYTRAAHIRELFGDSEGAIEIMGMAVRAASSRDREHSAWCRVQLGNLLFNAGRLAAAESQYQAALQVFPEYHYALTGMGKVRVAQKQFDEAVKFYETSINFLPTHDAVATLADLFTYLKRPEEAARQYQLVDTIEQINRANGVQPESHIALFYADHDLRLDEALRIAQEHAKKRNDIRTLDTLSWVLFKNGRYQEALAASKRAMRLGTQDALMFYHHGMIQTKLGHDNEASEALQRALSINPYFHFQYSEQARATLEQPLLTAKSASLTSSNPLGR